MCRYKSKDNPVTSSFFNGTLSLLVDAARSSASEARRSKAYFISGENRKTCDTVPHPSQSQLPSIDEVKSGVAASVLRTSHNLDKSEGIVRDDDGRAQYHYALVDFAATYVSGELRAATDVLDTRWISLSELKQYPMSRKAREIIRQSFKHAAPRAE